VFVAGVTDVVVSVYYSVGLGAVLVMLLLLLNSHIVLLEHLFEIIEKGFALNGRNS